MRCFCMLGFDLLIGFAGSAACSAVSGASSRAARSVGERFIVLQKKYAGD